jgi:hypothetical protein
MGPHDRGPLAPIRPMAALGTQSTLARPMCPMDPEGYCLIGCHSRAILRKHAGGKCQNCNTPRGFMLTATFRPA